MKTMKKDARRILVILAASCCMALNINMFVHAGGLYPGGATGLTVLIQRIGLMIWEVEIPYTIVNLLLNAFPIYIGFKYIGKKFTLYSCLMIVVTNVLTDLIPYVPITYDTLLVSVFGGLINGFSISLCLGVNATSGGTDFIAIYLSEKKGMDSWNLVLGINMVILGAAGLLFGWDKALYSIIFQFVSTQVLHTLYKRYQRETLFIVTKKPEEICALIHKICHHGATVLDGKGGYEGEDRKIVYSVISAGDKVRVMNAVREVDPGVFINTIKTEQLSGRFYMEAQD